MLGTGASWRTTGARPDGAQDQNIELKAAQSCGLTCTDSGWNPQENRGFIRQHRNTASCRWLHCMQKASPHFTLEEQVHCKLFWHVSLFLQHISKTTKSAQISHMQYIVYNVCRQKPWNFWPHTPEQQSIPGQCDIKRLRYDGSRSDQFVTLSLRLQLNAENFFFSSPADGLTRVPTELQITDSQTSKYVYVLPVILQWIPSSEKHLLGFRRGTLKLCECFFFSLFFS